MRGLVSLLVVLALSIPLLGGPAASADDPAHAHCPAGWGGVTVETVVLASGGEDVTGCLAYADDAIPQDVHTLVVMTHGFGHTVQASWVAHMVETVQQDAGIATIAMNYRDNFGFPILRGAEDTIRGTLYAQGRFPAVTTTILYSVSLGATIGGTAIHVAPAMNDGAGLYDHWLAIEPAANPLETYVAAKALAPFLAIGRTASEGMERDAGGTPADAPEAWALRIPVLHAEDIEAAGVQSVFVAHGLNDGLVPYDQGRELVTVLRGVGLPVEMVTIGRGAPDHTSGTTPTSHVGQPQFDPNEQFLHLAGHGSEADRGHILTATGLERLFAFLDCAAIVDSEHVLDHELGQHRVL